MREGGVQQGGGRVLLRYVLPLSELASNFFSELKSRTQGYATLDYEVSE
jgi:translation elongation factor EF-4